MILLSCQRWPPVAIAQLLGCDVATVRRWIHRYESDGVAGLHDRPPQVGPDWAAHGWVHGSDGCLPRFPRPTLSQQLQPLGPTRVRANEGSSLAYSYGLARWR
jgi:hypothetical protein